MQKIPKCDAHRYLCTSETNLKKLENDGKVKTEWDDASGEYQYTQSSLMQAAKDGGFQTYQDLSNKLNDIYMSSEAWNLDKDVFDTFVTLIRVIGEKIKESNTISLYYNNKVR